MKTLSTVVLLSVLALAVVQTPLAALEVTLDSGGSGAVTLEDTDMDHVIDFDVTVGGVFRAKGRVLESLGTITKAVTLTSTPPDSMGTFAKIGVGAGTAATFTVTVNSSPFTPTGTPIGFTAAYVGNAGDSMGGIVDIPSNSVAVTANNGDLALTTINGPPIIAPTAIDLESDGVVAGTTAAQIQVVFAFTPGPDDQILLPDNNGFDNKSIEVNVFNQSQDCVERMNNDARRVGQLATKSDFTCAKRGTGDVTACVDDPNDAKTDKKEQKLISDFADKCNPVPAWGVNGATCCEGGASDGALCAGPADCSGGTCTGGACISAAAEDGAGAIAHDIFGPTVNISSSKKPAVCQEKVLQRAGKLYVAHWKAFRICKKNEFASITNDATLKSVCLGPPQNDPKGLINRELSRLDDKVAKKCVKAGVTPVGAQFPGLCTAASDATFADCVAARVACRFCQSVNRADAILPPLNCDTFDDGVSNASCSP
jgi:hypothetical protein